MLSFSKLISYPLPLWFRLHLVLSLVASLRKTVPRTDLVRIDNISISSEYEDVFFQPDDDHDDNKENESENDESTFLHHNEAYAACIFRFGLVLCSIITGNTFTLPDWSPTVISSLSLVDIRAGVEHCVIDGIPPVLEALAYQCCEDAVANRPTDKLIYREIKDLLEIYQPLKEQAQTASFPVDRQSPKSKDSVFAESKIDLLRQRQAQAEAVSHCTSSSISIPSLFLLLQ